MQERPLKSPVVVVVVRLTTAITVSEKPKLYTGHERTYIIVYIIFVESGELTE